MLLGLGVLAQIGVDLWIGGRLLNLARRTRGIPELGFGLCLLLFGGIGMPLSVVARRGPFEAAAANEGLLAVALGLENVGSFALLLATWRIFRSDTQWARAFVGLCGAVMLVSTPVSGADAGVLYWLGVTARGLAFLWSAIEATRYRAMLVRRRSLGLADPVVIDRMGLWALSCAGCVMGFVVFVGGRLLGLDPTIPPVMIAQSLAAGGTGVALWLAFAPPQTYLDRRARD